MAMNHYRQGLKFDPEHKGCKEGYRLLKKLQGLLGKAQKAFDSRDFSSAIKMYNSIIEIDPGHRFIVPRSNLKLADSYRELKQYKEAKECILKAIDADARKNEVNYNYHVSLGKIHMDMSEFDEAIAQFRKVFIKNMHLQVIFISNLNSFIYFFSYSFFLFNYFRRTKLLKEITKKLMMNCARPKQP